MASTKPVLVITRGGAAAWLYTGSDERGRELEIIAVEVHPPGAAPYLLVLRVMPTLLRG
jgi:hypothetical protein